MTRIEPITSLQDPIQDIEESEPHQRRLVIYRMVIALGFLLLVGQLWRLQIVEGQRYRLRADYNRFRLMAIEAPRGVIYDRSKAILARNRPTYAVGIVPADLPPEPEPVYRRLSSAVGLPTSQIRQLVEGRKTDRFTFITIRADIPQDLAFILEERHRELPGVHVVVQPVREYPEGPLTAHLLGYTGPITQEQYSQLKEDKARRYGYNDRIGQTGVEAHLEREIRGSPGERRLEVDAAGREVRLLAVDQPSPGNNLILTLDLELQRKLTEILSAKLDRYGTASAVALDPSTGQVLALVHLPSYDNNAFSRGITEQDLQALINDDRKPLVNGAIGAAYPPGTLFQAITAAGALEENVIKPDTKANCPGQLIVPSRLDPTLGVRFGDFAAHGDQDVVSALADSCKVFFYLAGGGDPEGKSGGLGIDRLVAYAKLFGFGALSGIDLDGEAAGFLGTPDWKKQNHGELWYKGDTYLAANGEEYLLVTPLQMANAIAAIANGGTLYRPQVVLQVTDDQGTVLKPYEPSPIRRLPISPENLQAIREGLRAATKAGESPAGTRYQGTARSVSVPGFEVAGTVATIEYARPERRSEPRTHGWFAGFGPVDNPQIALVIFLRDGKGAEEAGEIAEQAFATYLQSANSRRGDGERSASR